MAKNFVQDGTTIELVNAGDQTILSGAAVLRCCGGGRQYGGRGHYRYSCR